LSNCETCWRLTHICGGWQTGGVETSQPFFLGYPSPDVFPVERYKQYLALLKQTGGMLASRSDGEPSEPNIVLWAWGWAGDTKHIGICWMKKAPLDEITTLDGFTIESRILTMLRSDTSIKIGICGLICNGSQTQLLI
jgi:hypothetical protein